MDFELPPELAGYLDELDAFIEREIKPLEAENDNIGPASWKIGSSACQPRQSLRCGHRACAHTVGALLLNLRGGRDGDVLRRS